MEEGRPLRRSPFFLPSADPPRRLRSSHGRPARARVRRSIPRSSPTASPLERSQADLRRRARPRGYLPFARARADATGIRGLQPVWSGAAGLALFVFAFQIGGAPAVGLAALALQIPAAIIAPFGSAARRPFRSSAPALARDGSCSRSFLLLPAPRCCCKRPRGSPSSSHAWRDGR